MASSTGNKADRIFVQNGRRAYRRTFSATETHVGLFIVFTLVAIVGWIAWKGANPDPALFMLETDLSQEGIVESADRGPIPTELVETGWDEGAVSQFDFDNLYVKINGREGYYKSFGFERLYFLSLESAGDPQVIVDIELYDLGNAANAIGAYAGERAPETEPQATDSGLAHMDRNALYLTRGRYYLRAIGSQESPTVRAQLDRLLNRFQAQLPGEPLPWGYALLSGRMGIDPGALAFAPENAFSFGFARNVYSATLENGAELFVTPAPTEDAAVELAGRFREGFLQYGEAEGNVIRDRYLGSYATVTTAGPWVAGVRRAPDVETATSAVEELVQALVDWPLPDETEDAPADQPEEDYEADAY